MSKSSVSRDVEPADEEGGPTICTAGENEKSIKEIGKDDPPSFLRCSLPGDNTGFVSSLPMLVL